MAHIVPWCIIAKTENAGDKGPYSFSNREAKFIETLRKVLAKLQHELTKAYNQTC